MDISINEKVIDKRCYASIQSISNLGLVKIYFSMPIDTISNVSYINDSNTQIYAIPHMYQSDSSVRDLNLTWYAVSFNKKIIEIQLNFSSPLDISSEDIKDQLVVNFNQSQSFLKCKINNLTLDVLNYTLIKYIR